MDSNGDGLYDPLMPTDVEDEPFKSTEVKAPGEFPFPKFPFMPPGDKIQNGLPDFPPMLPPPGDKGVNGLPHFPGLPMPPGDKGLNGLPDFPMPPIGKEIDGFPKLPFLPPPPGNSELYKQRERWQGDTRRRS